MTQYTEALLNDDRCFLEQHMWQNVFRSVVREVDALSDTSGIVVSLWTTICRIPGLFKDIQYAVCNSIDTDTRTIENLLARVQETRCLLLQWRTQFEDLLPSLNTPKQCRDGKKVDTLGVYMANLILMNRLSVSLNPRAGAELETQTQDVARRILQLRQMTSTVNPRASLFMAFKVITAQAILDTQDEWQRAIDLAIQDDACTGPLIRSQVFERWVRLKGRKITVLSAAPM